MTLRGRPPYQSPAVRTHDTNPPPPPASKGQYQEQSTPLLIVYFVLYSMEHSVSVTSAICIPFPRRLLKGLVVTAKPSSHSFAKSTTPPCPPSLLPPFSLLPAHHLATNVERMHEKEIIICSLHPPPPLPPVLLSPWLNFRATWPSTASPAKATR